MMARFSREEAPLLLTKIQIPRRPAGVLRRGRLVEKLHSYLHRKLSFITAPAGFGKTTLLVDFAHEAPANVAWYRITEDDKKLVRFVRYVAGAFAQIFPALRGALTEILDQGLPSQNPVMLARWFNNVLAEHVDDFTLLVLDDYHLVGEQLEVVDFVEAWIEHLPDQVRLLVASRSVYGIPTTRLYLRGDLGLIGPDELRFTADELQALARLAYGVELPSDYAADLATRTDGWVIAMLLAVRLRTEGRIPVIRGEREELYTFLADEVLRYLPSYLVTFLLKTGIFEEFTSSFCRQVLEEPKADDYLEEIENRNLFVTRVETTEGSVYRYHQLFGEFLRNRVRQEGLEDSFRRWHHRAAAWYWEHGQAEQAVAHKLAAGDRPGAARWMDAAAKDAFIKGQLDLLEQWVALLTKPPDLRSQTPRLLLYYARVLGNQRRFEASDHLLSLAKPALETLGEPLLLANLFETQGFNAYMQEKYEQAAHLAAQGIALVEKLSSSAERDLRRAQLRRVEALAVFHLGLRSKAIKQLENVVADLEALARLSSPIGKEGAYNRAVAFQDLGIFYFQEGRLSDALGTFLEVRRLWREHSLNPVECPAILNNLAFLYLRLGEQDKALEVYLEARQRARQLSSKDLVAVLAGLGEIYYEKEQWQKAEETFREATTIGKEEPGAKAFLAAAYRGLAKLYAAQGFFSKSFNALRQAALLLKRPETSAWYRWRKGQLYWLLGEEKIALENLLPVVRGREIDSLLPEDRARVLLISAALLNRQGEKATAFHLLGKALEVVERLGYVHFLGVEVRRERDFLRQMGRQIAHPILEELLYLANETPSTVEVVEERREWPIITAKALGSSEVWRGKDRIERKAWRAVGARALFFFILDRREVYKEEIALAFWPDFSPARVNSNLHATLWRVRRALGEKAFIQAQGGRYRLHPSLEVRYDVAAFEALLRQAEAAEGRAKIALLTQAAKKYGGDFLPRLDFPWVDERRQELQRRYRETVNLLIEDAMQQAAFEEAMQWLEPALAVDPYNDQWHFQWIQCLVQTGARAAAWAHYHEYRRRLKSELGLDPDPALQRFAEQL